MLLGWAREYKPGWLRFDLIAGVTAAAVVIPQAMAYASIAGLPVEIGLYTALFPMLAYALLGTSRSLSVSTTSTIAILTASALGLLVNSSEGYDLIAPAAMLALLVGGMLALAGILRLGFIANFISLPVLTGFKAGIGIVLIVSQLGKVLGIPEPKARFFQMILQLLKDYNQANLLTILLSAVMLGVIILLPRWSKRLPAALVVVIIGILATYLFDLQDKGVALVGTIPAGLPSPALPDFSLVGQLWMPAVGIALMAFVESIAAARIFLRKDDQPLQANQELVALGLANIGGSLFQSLPSGGGTSQTAVNDDAGAKSQLAGVVTAGVTALTLILLAPLVSLMPEATLGVLVIVAAFKLINLGEYRRLYSYRRAEFIWAVVSLLGVIFVGTLQGILVAIVVSLMAITYHADHPPVYVLGRKPGTDIFRPLEEYPEDEKFPGLLLLRSVGLLYFGSVPSAIKKIDDLVNQYQPKVVVLDCSAIPNIEYTALKQVEDYEENLQKGGVSLWLARLNPECLKLVENSNLGKKLGKERMFYNLEQVVEYYKTLQPASDSA